VFFNDASIYYYFCQALFDNASLEARFRPEDRYSKPAIAKDHRVTNLVLRVRRRRKAQPSSDPGEGEFEYSTQLLGIANTEFTFPG